MGHKDHLNKFFKKLKKKHTQKTQTRKVKNDKMDFIKISFAFNRHN